MKTMKKKILKIFVCIFVCLACVCGGLFLGVGGQSQESFGSQVANASDDGISLQERNTTWKRIQKNIVIDENKTCEITQLVTVRYARSGINVGVSLQVSRVNEITRIYNGKTYVTKTIANLNNLSARVKKGDGDFVEEFSELENSGAFYFLNIGELGKYKDNEEDYTFEVKYTYDFGEDFISDFDDFTFDLMDYDYIQKVGEFAASVTLPKEFLSQDQPLEDVLSFRTNRKKELGFEAVQAQFDNQTLTISCQYPGVVPAETGLTMQLILPNKYFNTSFAPNYMYYVAMIVTILVSLAIVACLLVSRKGRKAVITTEFYPPENFNPIDVAKAYRGSVKPKDFASLVLYWAGKGYVDLIPRRNGKAFTIEKLKDMEEPIAGTDNYMGKVYEKKYFDALFNKSNVYDTEHASKIVNSKLSSAIDNLYDMDDSTKKKTRLFKWLIQILAILPMLCFIIWNITVDSNAFLLLFMFLFPLIALMVFMHAKMGWALIWFKVIWCAGFGIVPFLFMKNYMFLTLDIFNLFWINVAVLVLGTLAVKIVRVCSHEYDSVRGKILGFKKFLVKVEVDKLERLIHDNPNYYFDILPFCYVFGITKVMEKKFSSLRVELPEYYHGFSTRAMYIYLGRSMSSISCSSSSSHSGGGFSGGGGGHGGSSGGGGGGGGGRGR